MSTEEINRKAGGRDAQESGPPRRQRGWFGRNWLWFVPALLLAIVVVGGAAGYWALFTQVYNLEVCRSAMRTIEADARVREALGEPIQTVKWPSRSAAPSARIEDSEIDVRWNIEGPKGRAKAHARAEKRQGKWQTVVMEVEFPDLKKVMLNEAGDTEAEAPTFTSPKPEAKKPEKDAPAPEINLQIPPDNNAPAK